jgi:hypothetical protein
LSGRGVPLAAALVAVLALAGTALAYVRTTSGDGYCLWWSKRTIPYVVNDFSSTAPASPATDVCGVPTSVPTVLAAVQASFTAWTQAGQNAGTGTPACTDLQFTYGTTSSTATGNDGQNVVVVRRGPCGTIVPSGDACQGDGTCADKYNCWDHSGSADIIALTTVTYRPSTGEIIDADVELNGWDGTGSLSGADGYYFTCGNYPTVCTAPGQQNCIYMDVQNTVTHEAGHFLGLGHTTVSGATMFPSASAGDTNKRTLEADDVSGICSIYPAGQATANCIDGPCPAPCVPPPKSGGGCGYGSAGPEALLGLLGLMALRRWQKRPHTPRSTFVPPTIVPRTPSSLA